MKIQEVSENDILKILNEDSEIRISFSSIFLFLELKLRAKIFMYEFSNIFKERLFPRFLKLQGVAEIFMKKFHRSVSFHKTEHKINHSDPNVLTELVEEGYEVGGPGWLRAG